MRISKQRDLMKGCAPSAMAIYGVYNSRALASVMGR